MAVYYIDTDWGGTASGTQAQPYTNFSSVTLADGDIVRFKRGSSSHASATTIVFRDNVTFEDYGSASAARPILTTTDGANGLHLYTGRGYGSTIRNLEITGSTAAQGRNINITALAYDYSEVANILIENCILHDAGLENIRVTASYVTIQNCTLYDADEDNFYGEGFNNTIEGCHMYNPERSVPGDNIQIASSQNNGGNWVVRNNILDQTGATKNCVIFDNNGTGNIVENNICYVGNYGITLRDEGIICRRNKVIATNAAGFTRGISIDSIGVDSSDSMEVYSNIIDGGSSAGNAQALIWVTDTTGSVIYNNTIINGNTEPGINVYQTTAINTEVRNNIFINCDVGMVLSTLAVNTIETNNLFYGNTVNIETQTSVPVTPDASDVIADPQLDSSYRPLFTSPVRGAGVTIDPAMTDYEGVLFEVPPSIGAYSMILDWPASLPQYLRLQGYAQTRVNDTIRSTMGYGPDKVRRRTTATIENVQGTLVLTDAQLSTFLTYYDDTLTGGTETLRWINFQTNALAEYRFLTPPTYSNIGKFWTVVMSLE
ncbi:MAG: right-handed parallel beta-helix repeat-containing protein, partial [Nitrosomonadaceae bacterium]